MKHFLSLKRDSVDSRSRMNTQVTPKNKSPSIRKGFHKNLSIILEKEREEEEKAKSQVGRHFM
jgi:hypothetical protein